MKNIHKLLLISLGILFSLTSEAGDFNTPENAVKSLEAAYINKDIEAAVTARDFYTEAKLMLQHIKPQFANDSEILKETSSVLELAFRAEMKKHGFPDFSNVKCTLGKPQNITHFLVKLTETCIYPDGGDSVQDIHVFKGEKGWRLVNVPK